MTLGSCPPCQLRKYYLGACGLYTVGTGRQGDKICRFLRLEWLSAVVRSTLVPPENPSPGI